MSKYIETWHTVYDVIDVIFREDGDGGRDKFLRFYFDGERPRCRNNLLMVQRFDDGVVEMVDSGEWNVLYGMYKEYLDER